MEMDDKTVCGCLVFLKPNKPLSATSSKYLLRYGDVVRIGSKEGDDIRLNHLTDMKTDAVLIIAEDSGSVQATNPEYAETYLNDSRLSAPKYLLPGDQLHIKGKIFMYDARLSSEVISLLKTKNQDGSIRQVPKKRHSVMMYSTGESTTKYENEEMVIQEPTVFVREGFEFQAEYLPNPVTPSKSNYIATTPRMRKLSINSAMSKTANNILAKRKPSLRRFSMDGSSRSSASPFLRLRKSYALSPKQMLIAMADQDLIDWNTPPLSTGSFLARKLTPLSLGRRSSIAGRSTRNSTISESFEDQNNTAERKSVNQSFIPSSRKSGSVTRWSIQNISSNDFSEDEYEGDVFVDSRRLSNSVHHSFNSFEDSPVVAGRKSGVSSVGRKSVNKLVKRSTLGHIEEENPAETSGNIGTRKSANLPRRSASQNFEKTAVKFSNKSGIVDDTMPSPVPSTRRQSRLSTVQNKSMNESVIEQTPAVERFLPQIKRKSILSAVDRTSKNFFKTLDSSYASSSAGASPAPNSGRKSMRVSQIEHSIDEMKEAEEQPVATNGRYSYANRSAVGSPALNSGRKSMRVSQIEPYADDMEDAEEQHVATSGRQSYANRSAVGSAALNSGRKSMRFSQIEPCIDDIEDAEKQPVSTTIGRQSYANSSAVGSPAPNSGRKSIRLSQIEPSIDDIEDAEKQPVSTTIGRQSYANSSAVGSPAPNSGRKSMRLSQIEPCQDDIEEVEEQAVATRSGRQSYANSSAVGSSAPNSGRKSMRLSQIEPCIDDIEEAEEQPVATTSGRQSYANSSAVGSAAPNSGRKSMRLSQIEPCIDDIEEAEEQPVATTSGRQSYANSSAVGSPAPNSGRKSMRLSQIERCGDDIEEVEEQAVATRSGRQSYANSSAVGSSAPNSGRKSMRLSQIEPCIDDIEEAEEQHVATTSGRQSYANSSAVGSAAPNSGRKSMRLSQIEPCIDDIEEAEEQPVATTSGRQSYANSSAVGSPAPNSGRKSMRLSQIERCGDDIEEVEEQAVATRSGRQSYANSSAVGSSAPNSGRKSMRLSQIEPCIDDIEEAEEQHVATTSGRQSYANSSAIGSPAPNSGRKSMRLSQIESCRDDIEEVEEEADATRSGRQSYANSSAVGSPAPNSGRKSMRLSQIELVKDDGEEAEERSDVSASGRRSSSNKPSSEYDEVDYEEETSILDKSAQSSSGFLDISDKRSTRPSQVSMSDESFEEEYTMESPIKIGRKSVSSTILRTSGRISRELNPNESTLSVSGGRKSSQGSSFRQKSMSTSQRDPSDVTAEDESTAFEESALDEEESINDRRFLRYPKSARSKTLNDREMQSPKHLSIGRKSAPSIVTRKSGNISQLNDANLSDIESPAIGRQSTASRRSTKLAHSNPTKEEDVEAENYESQSHNVTRRSGRTSEIADMSGTLSPVVGRRSLLPRKSVRTVQDTDKSILSGSVLGSGKKSVYSEKSYQDLSWDDLQDFDNEESYEQSPLKTSARTSERFSVTRRSRQSLMENVHNPEERFGKRLTINRRSTRSQLEQSNESRNQPESDYEEYDDAVSDDAVSHKKPTRYQKSALSKTLNDPSPRHVSTGRKSAPSALPRTPGKNLEIIDVDMSDNQSPAVRSALSRRSTKSVTKQSTDSINQQETNESFEESTRDATAMEEEVLDRSTRNKKIVLSKTLNDSIGQSPTYSRLARKSAPSTIAGPSCNSSEIIDVDMVDVAPLVVDRRSTISRKSFKRVISPAHQTMEDSEVENTVLDTSGRRSTCARSSVYQNASIISGDLDQDKSVVQSPIKSARRSRHSVIEIMDSPELNISVLGASKSPAPSRVSQSTHGRRSTKIQPEQPENCEEERVQEHSSSKRRSTRTLNLTVREDTDNFEQRSLRDRSDKDPYEEETPNHSERRSSRRSASNFNKTQDLNRDQSSIVEPLVEEESADASSFTASSRRQSAPSSKLLRNLNDSLEKSYAVEQEERPESPVLSSGKFQRRSSRTSSQSPSKLGKLQVSILMGSPDLSNNKHAANRRSVLKMPQYDDVTMEEEDVEAANNSDQENSEDEINISGIRRIQKSPNNDLSDVTGVKHLFAGPAKTPRLDGVKAMFNSERSPKNDLTDIVGVKKLFTAKSPLNDLSNIASGCVKQVFRVGPYNSYSHVENLKEVFRRSPRNDLTNVSYVKRVFKANTPKNDLTNVEGMNKLFRNNAPRQVQVTPDLQQSKMFKTPKTLRKTAAANFAEKLDEEEEDYASPKGSMPSNDSFDSLVGKPAYKIYKPKNHGNSPGGDRKVMNDSLSETFDSIKKKRKLAKTPRALAIDVSSEKNLVSQLGDTAVSQPRLSLDLFNAKMPEHLHGDLLEETPGKNTSTPLPETSSRTRSKLNINMTSVEPKEQTIVKNEGQDVNNSRSTRRNLRNDHLETPEHVETPTRSRRGKKVADDFKENVKKVDMPKQMVTTETSKPSRSTRNQTKEHLVQEEENVEKPVRGTRRNAKDNVVSNDDNSKQQKGKKNVNKTDDKHDKEILNISIENNNKDKIKQDAEAETERRPARGRRTAKEKKVESPVIQAVEEKSVPTQNARHVRFNEHVNTEDSRDESRDNVDDKKSTRSKLTTTLKTKNEEVENEPVEAVLTTKPKRGTKRIAVDTVTDNEVEGNPLKKEKVNKKDEGTTKKTSQRNQTEEVVVEETTKKTRKPRHKESDNDIEETVEGKVEEKNVEKPKRKTRLNAKDNVASSDDDNKQQKGNKVANKAEENKRLNVNSENNTKHKSKPDAATGTETKPTRSNKTAKEMEGASPVFEEEEVEEKSLPKQNSKQVRFNIQLKSKQIKLDESKDLMDDKKSTRTKRTTTQKTEHEKLEDDVDAVEIVPTAKPKRGRQKKVKDTATENEVESSSVKKGKGELEDEVEAVELVPKAKPKRGRPIKDAVTQNEVESTPLKNRKADLADDVEAVEVVPTTKPKRGRQRTVNDIKTEVESSPVKKGKAELEDEVEAVEVVQTTKPKRGRQRIVNDIKNEVESSPVKKGKAELEDEVEAVELVPTTKSKRGRPITVKNTVTQKEVESTPLKKGTVDLEDDVEAVEVVPTTKPKRGRQRIVKDIKNKVESSPLKKGEVDLEDDVEAVEVVPPTKPKRGRQIIVKDIKNAVESSPVKKGKAVNKDEGTTKKSSQTNQTEDVEETTKKLTKLNTKNNESNSDIEETMEEKPKRGRKRIAKNDVVEIEVESLKKGKSAKKDEKTSKKLLKDQTKEVIAEEPTRKSKRLRK